MKTATLAFLAAAIATPAWGQAIVVSTCGVTPIAAGGSHYLTVDTNGAVCRKTVNSTGCGGTTIAVGGLHNWVVGTNGVTCSH